ncbi:DMT family transporter [Sphingomonas sp. MMS24-J13]|uniref:DMT family transporter n=1 Tax=Sphingomonas sp. MMS24-J13 TaxID=3238686 RepID=UPI00384CF752
MSRTDWGIIFALALLWGGSFFFIGVAIRSVTPLTLVLVRVTLAAAFLWFWRAMRREPLALPPKAVFALVVLALLNTVLPFALFAWAQRTLPSGLASILNATTPIWTVIVAHLFTSDEKATPAKILGVLLGFAGVAVMIGADLLGQIGTHLFAQLACLMASLCYGFAGVWARRFRGMGLDPVAVTTGQFTAATLLLSPLVLLFEPPWHASAPAPVAWAALIGLALLSTAFAYVLYFKLLESAGATNSLLVTFLIPVTAVLLGSLFLGERLEPRHLAGMGLIALGLVAIDGRLLVRRRQR